MPLNNIEIKLVTTNPTHETCNTIGDTIEAIINKLNSPLSYNTIKVSNIIDLSNLESRIKAEWEDTSVRQGVTGGCYGARDGSYFTGLTLWIHPQHVTDRYVDSEYGEQVNPWYILNEYGTHKPNIDAEALLELLDESGVEYKSDNTYNYSGCSEDAGFIFDFQFDHIIINKKHFLAVMFHCGGDPRGNYTSKELWAFDSEADIHSVLFPYKQLTEEEA